jgi:adenylosuccinate lyase
VGGFLALRLSANQSPFRHEYRLCELKPRVLVLQFGGAAGTLGSLEDRGEAVSAALAEELQLALPSTHGTPIATALVKSRVSMACFRQLLAKSRVIYRF